ncbi:MAG: hypothetical protein AABX51_02155 [Nanoarchaeota archaeon]
MDDLERKIRDAGANNKGLVVGQYTLHGLPGEPADYNTAADRVESFEGIHRKRGLETAVWGRKIPLNELYSLGDKKEPTDNNYSSGK